LAGARDALSRQELVTVDTALAKAKALVMQLSDQDRLHQYSL
jgi:hypothetical protein